MARTSTYHPYISLYSWKSCAVWPFQSWNHDTTAFLAIKWRWSLIQNKIRRSRSHLPQKEDTGLMRKRSDVDVQRVSQVFAPSVRLLLPLQPYFCPLLFLFQPFRLIYLNSFLNCHDSETLLSCKDIRPSILVVARVTRHNHSLPERIRTNLHKFVRSRVHQDGVSEAASGEKRRMTSYQLPNMIIWSNAGSRRSQKFDATFLDNGRELKVNKKRNKTRESRSYRSNFCFSHLPIVIDEVHVLTDPQFFRCPETTCLNNVN